VQEFCEIIQVFQRLFGWLLFVDSARMSGDQSGRLGSTPGHQKIDREREDFSAMQNEQRFWQIVNLGIDVFSIVYGRRIDKPTGYRWGPCSGITECDLFDFNAVH
jgi:hypothetical protein